VLRHHRQGQNGQPRCPAPGASGPPGPAPPTARRGATPAGGPASGHRQPRSGSRRLYRLPDRRRVPRPRRRPRLGRRRSLHRRRGIHGRHGQALSQGPSGI
ncbi:MAG: YciL protein, partial [Olavius algarvensis Gamma 1 endosymbiont]